MVNIFLEDMPLCKHVSFDSGAAEQRHFSCLCYPEVCWMRGPPQSSWVLKWGSWPGLCQPPPRHCHATLQVRWACTGCQVPAARSQPSLALQRSWPVKNHCHLSPGAAPGRLQISEVYSLSRSSVNVLACLSHRARRTGHPKSAPLMFLAALKINKKLG